MDLNDTPELAEYRTRVRAWLSEHAADAPSGGGDVAVAARREWQRKLAEAGLAAVTWPAEYGGQGLGPLHQVVVNQEIGRAGVLGDLRRDRRRDARADDHRPRRRGSEAALPGADADRRRGVVPAVLRARRRLGPRRRSRRARATRTTERWRLSGQKVWTTNAQLAAFGLLLARTDADVPKHKGLTMFVVPMDAAGVAVRPLRQISGDAHFNEVFFDDVVLPAGQRGRAGRRRLGRRDDHADVRAGGDRARRRGLRLARRPLRRRRCCATRPRRTTRGAPPVRRDRGRVPGAALHRLPHAHGRSARAASPARRPRWRR